MALNQKCRPCCLCLNICFVQQFIDKAEDGVIMYILSL